MGILFAIIASILSSAKDLVSKRLAFEVSGGVSALASFVFALPFYFVMLLILYVLGLEDFRVSEGFFTGIVIRAASDAMAEWMKMTALTKGEVSLVACYFSLSPVFLLILSPLVTGDRISAMGVVGVLIIVCGSLVAIPRRKESATAEETARNRSAILWALGASFFFAINNCYDRVNTLNASAPLSAFGVTLLPAIFLSPVLIRDRNTLQTFKALRKPFFSRGFLEMAFMTTKLIAMKFMPAPYVTALQRFSILISIFGGKVLYEEKDTLRRVAAGALVMTGVVVVLLAM